MFAKNSSLIDFNLANPKIIEKLFSFAQSLQMKALPPRNNGEYAIVAIFEASTRTRLSFEAALARAGIAALVFDGGLKTSLEKGESIDDSILNMAAMNPQLMVIRCGENVDLEKYVQKFSFPFLNAGWGTKSHPSQALLDAFTLRQQWKTLAGKKLLIVGDVKHSRVASSHIDLAQALGYEVAQCGPSQYLSSHSQIKTFSEISAGLQWADAVMALRFQFERHDKEQEFSRDHYSAEYGLNQKRLKQLKADAWILHPGPINHGIEIESDVLLDPRCLVLKQVSNGVYVREAIVRMVLGENA